MSKFAPYLPSAASPIDESVAVLAGGGGGPSNAITTAAGDAITTAAGDPVTTSA